MIFQLSILIVLFAILNRIRGGWLIQDSKYFNSNWMAALIFGAIPFIISGNSWFILVGGIAYLLGESDGWGTWIGYLTERYDTRAEKEGILQTIFNVNVGRFFSPFNYYVECVINLSLRGIQWWALYAIVLWYSGVSVETSLIFAFGLGSLMPLAYILADDWEVGEIYYGGFIGMFIYYVLYTKGLV